MARGDSPHVALTHVQNLFVICQSTRLRASGACRFGAASQFANLSIRTEQYTRVLHLLPRLIAPEHIDIRIGIALVGRRVVLPGG